MRTRRIGALALGFGALVSASCGDTAGGGHSAGRDDSSDSGTSNEHAAWYEARVEAACARRVRCGSYSSLRACVEIEGNLATWGRHFGGADVFADLASEFALADEDTREACLAELESLDCAKLNGSEPAICAEVLVPRAPRAEGESCRDANLYLPLRPCEEGLVCQNIRCPTCAPAPAPAGAGAVCDSSSGCGEDLICSSATDPPTCAPPPVVGEPCPSGICANAACLGFVCVPYVGLGAPCGDTASCAGDLACEGGTCVAHRLPRGETCSRPASGVADYCNEWCLFDSAEAPAGVCGLPSTDPGPCSAFGDNPYPFCPLGTYVSTSVTNVASDAFPTDCTCQPKLLNGATCTGAALAYFDENPCKDGFCSTGGNCEPRFAEDAACTSHQECESFACDVASGLCAPAATCENAAGGG